MCCVGSKGGAWPEDSQLYKAPYPLQTSPGEAGVIRVHPNTPGQTGADIVSSFRLCGMVPARGGRWEGLTGSLQYARVCRGFPPRIPPASTHGSRGSHVATTEPNGRCPANQSGVWGPRALRVSDLHHPPSSAPSPPSALAALPPPSDPPRNLEATPLADSVFRRPFPSPGWGP